MGGGPELMGGSRGARMIAFVIGGFTFSELRVAHRLAARSGRDVLLGGTGIQTPAHFIEQLVALGGGPSPSATFEIEQQQQQVSQPTSSMSAGNSAGGGGRFGISVRRKG